MYEAIVIGASAGGLKALKTIVKDLPVSFQLPLLIVQHMSPQSDSFMARYLNQLTHLQVKEADEKEPVRPGHIYIAPPNFHLLVEENHTLSLTVDEKVNYARPSIDVLFETASIAWKQRLAGIVLTGANSDGARGVCSIKARGGLTVAQSPQTADSAEMPAAAIETGCIDHIIDLGNIAKFLNQLNESNRR